MRHLRIFLLAGAAIPFALAAQAPAQGAETPRYQTAQPLLMAEALPDEERKEEVGSESESGEADEEAPDSDEEAPDSEDADDETESEQEDMPESETETEAEAEAEAEADPESEAETGDDADAAPDRPDEQQSADEIDENGESGTREAGDRDDRRDEPAKAAQERNEEQPAPVSEDTRPEAAENARDGEREGLRDRLRNRDSDERRDRDRSQPSEQAGDDRPADDGDTRQPTSGEAESREEESERLLRQVPDEDRSRDGERPAAEQERNGEREGLRERRDRAEEGRRDRRDEAGDRRDRDEVRDEARDEAHDDVGERREDARERDDRERDARERRGRRDRGERRRDAREAQRELEEIAEEQEELRDEVRELREQRESELRELQSQIREQRRGDVVERRGDRIIIRSDNRYHIQHNDNRRFVGRAENIETRNLDRGWTETTVYRRDGVRVVTVRDRYGDIVTRSRVLRDGTEIVLIDNRRVRERERPRRRVDYYSDVLPPIRIDIPREQYIVETRQASRRDIQRALTAPPVERIEEVYSLEEVLYNERIRDMVPRVDLDTITFEFDSAEVPDDQIDTLEGIGYALEEVIYENPDEIYLVEGHTDAPGSNEYNLALSDRRAENVAMILTEFFEVPPENLITQGYGEEYLKIDTQERERRNRRVTVRRITPLMAESQ